MKKLSSILRRSTPFQFGAILMFFAATLIDSYLLAPINVAVTEYKNAIVSSAMDNKHHVNNNAFVRLSHSSWRNYLAIQRREEIKGAPLSSSYLDSLLFDLVELQLSTIETDEDFLDEVVRIYNNCPLSEGYRQNFDDIRGRSADIHEARRQSLREVELDIEKGERIPLNYFSEGAGVLNERNQATRAFVASQVIAIRKKASKAGKIHGGCQFIGTAFVIIGLFNANHLEKESHTVGL